MRRAFFFSIDALLAASLLVTALILITTYAPEQQPQEQAGHLAQDTILALSSMKVKEIQDPWVQDRIADGSIDDPDTSVIHQIGKYWATNESSNARTLAGIALEGMPGLEVRLEEDVLYNASGRNGTIAAARRMISGVAKGEALRGSTGAAYLQKVSAKRTNKYAYFGGFVGQGNVTARLDNLPGDLNSTNVKFLGLEGEFDEDFTLHINGAQCGGTYSKSPADLEIVSHNVTSCANLLQTGNNTVELRFTGLANGSVSGGFLKASYVTDEFADDYDTGRTTKYLPGIEGVINYYGGLSTPGTLNNLTLRLHYRVDGEARPIFFDIGNTTVYESNETGDVNVTLSNSYLSSLLDYNRLSDATVPIRFGYYEGNSTNTTGNITDVYLITSRAGPMSEADIEGTSETRMEAAKRLDETFTNIILANQGNREGLISYFASKNHDHSLSTDNNSLQSTIDGYTVQNPSQAERALCQSMEEARDRHTAEPDDRNKMVLLMTDGDTTKCCSSGKCTAEKARQDAIDVACDYYSTTGITYYTVGFGQEAANDPNVTGMLSEIANCTEGDFAQSTNITALEEIYEDFAAEIAESSVVYEFQRVTEASNIASTLHDDSRFDINYTSSVQPPGPAQLGITFQTEQFGSCNPTIDIAPELDVVEATLISYSGDYWTKGVRVDGTEVYNLTGWSDDYRLLGDPGRVQIPENLLGGGSHQLRLSIGANATDDQGCSNNNSLIYTALLNTSVSRGAVQPNAEGCTWTIEFEDNSTANATIPADYTGTKTCNYTSTDISYDETDSYDEVVHRLLDKLDFDDDGRVFVNLDESDLQVVVTLVSDVPYLWGPSIATVVIGR